MAIEMQEAMHLAGEEAVTGVLGSPIHDEVDTARRKRHERCHKEADLGSARTRGGEEESKGVGRHPKESEAIRRSPKEPEGIQSLQRASEGSRRHPKVEEAAHEALGHLEAAGQVQIVLKRLLDGRAAEHAIETDDDHLLVALAVLRAAAEWRRRGA